MARRWRSDDDEGIIFSSEAESDSENLLEDLFPSHERTNFVRYMVGQFDNYKAKQVGAYDQSIQNGGEGSFQGGRSPAAAGRRSTQGGRHGGKQLIGFPKNNNGNNEDEDGEEDTPPSYPPTPTEAGDGDSRCFACPFSKRSPHAHPRCGKRAFKTITRVKEHIWRVHDLGIYCYVCYQQFKAEPEQRDHMRAQVCQKLEEPPKDTITLEQRNQIKRRADPRKPKVQLWFDFFHILFPEAHLPPSPYVDSLLSLLSNINFERLDFFLFSRRENT